VLSAPYHRLSTGILAGHEIFSSPPDKAREVLARHRVMYVVICGPRAPAGLTEPQLSQSLWGKLQAGDPPGWLSLEPATKGEPLHVYRVRS
jgi:hypothetical protein